MKPRAKQQAFRLALIYVIAGGAWVAVSGAVLKRFTSSLGECLAVGAIQASVFVVATGGFLYLIWRQLLRQWEQEMEQREASEKNLRRKERALKTISACNGVLVRATREATLLAEICRVVVEKGGYRMAWVGFAEDNEEKSVQIPAYAGAEDGYLKRFSVYWDENHPRGRGPTGVAIRTGRVAISHDFQNDPNIAPWREETARHRFACSISLPLRDRQKTFGVLTIYAAETNAFNSEEVGLLTELAEDLAYGIQALRAQSERAKTEQSLRAAEEKYRLVFESARDAISTLDPATGKFIAGNPAAVKLFGAKSEAEFLLHGPQDFSPERQPDGRLSTDSIRASNEKLMQEGQQFFEWKHRRLNGEEFMADVLLTHMEQAGKPLVLATIRDISRRRKAEETLRESERKFSKMFHSSPMPMSLSTLKEGRFLDANHEFLKLLQRSREEVIGHTSLEVKMWRDLEQRAAILGNLNDDETVRNLELQIRRPSGQIREIIWSAEPMEVGGERCWLGSSLDITERKQAEESLRANEAFVRNVLDSLTAHIAVLDEQGKIVAVNQAWRRFANENGGSHTQGFLGGNYLTACQPDGGLEADSDASLAAEGLRAVMEGRQPSFQIEYACHTPTSKRWFLMHVWPLGHGGQGVVISHENITESKQTGRLLGFVAQEGWSRPQENYLVRLVEYIGQTLGVAYAFIGKRKDDQTVQTTGLYAKGKIVPDLEYSTRGAPCHNVIGKALCHYSDHLQEMFPDDALLGEMGAQSYLGIPLTDSAGKPLGLMALLDTKPMPEAQLATAILQIAGVRVAGEMERLAKVEELQWKTALLEAQMEAAPDGILMIDTQGRRVLQNQRMNDLLKIPPHISADEDIRLQIEFVASRAKDPRKMKDKIAYFYAHPEQISRDELEFVDGTIVDRYSSPVRNKNGGCCGRIWTFRDVTHARQLEAQLRQSQKMEAIGQLAGGVAHDFNNILASLIMQADLLEMAEFLPAEVTTGLQQIRADAMRAAQLTRQLLLFSRRQVMQSCRLDLNEVVTNLAKMLQRIIGEDVRLQLNLHPVPLMTCADAGMVEQVLLNLAVNARDAMPKGGRLGIETAEQSVTQEIAGLYPDARPGRYVCFSVSDTGTGIPPEILPKIFEPFFTTKEAGKGTGLGLATVFGIVKQHQGWLKVDNQPGQGATFRIFLPASTVTPDEAVQTEVKPKPRGGHETILLVEDEAAVRKTIRSLLERRGYQVVAATNGIEALDLWPRHSGKVALVLTDLVMPGGMTGYELARQLQSGQPNLKTIYMSGYSAEMAGREIALRPGEIFIQKPCAAALLLEAIRRSLEG